MENVFTKWLSLSGVKQVAVTKPYEYKGWVTMNGAHIFIGGGGGGGGGGASSGGGGGAAEAIPAHESIAKVASLGTVSGPATLKAHLDAIKLPSNYHLDVASLTKLPEGGKRFSANIKGGSGNTIIGTVQGTIHPSLGVIDSKISIHGYAGNEHLPHVNDLTNAISDGLSGMSKHGSKPEIAIAPKVAAKLSGAASLEAPKEAAQLSYISVSHLYNKPSEIIHAGLQSQLNVIKLPSNYHLDVAQVQKSADKFPTFSANIKGGSGDTIIGTVQGTIHPAVGIVGAKVSIHGYAGNEHLPHVNDLTSSISDGLKKLSSNEAKPEIAIAPKVAAKLSGDTSSVAPKEVANASLLPYQDIANTHRQTPQVFKNVVQDHLSAIKLPSNYHLKIEHIGKTPGEAPKHFFSADIKGGSGNTKVGTVIGVVDPSLGIVDAKILIHDYAVNEHLPYVNDLTNAISDGLSGMSGTKSGPQIKIAPKLLSKLGRLNAGAPVEGGTVADAAAIPAVAEMAASKTTEGLGSIAHMRVFGKGVPSAPLTIEHALDHDANMPNGLFFDAKIDPSLPNGTTKVNIFSKGSGDQLGHMFVQSTDAGAIKSVAVYFNPHVTLVGPANLQATALAQHLSENLAHGAGVPLTFKVLDGGKASATAKGMTAQFNDMAQKVQPKAVEGVAFGPTNALAGIHFTGGTSYASATPFADAALAIGAGDFPVYVKNARLSYGASIEVKGGAATVTLSDNYGRPFMKMTAQQGAGTSEWHANFQQLAPMSPLDQQAVKYYTARLKTHLAVVEKQYFTGEFIPMKGKAATTTELAKMTPAHYQYMNEHPSAVYHFLNTLKQNSSTSLEPHGKLQFHNTTDPGTPPGVLDYKVVNGETVVAHGQIDYSSVANQSHHVIAEPGISQTHLNYLKKNVATTQESLGAGKFQTLQIPGVAGKPIDAFGKPIVSPSVANGFSAAPLLSTGDLKLMSEKLFTEVHKTSPAAKALLGYTGGGSHGASSNLVNAMLRGQYDPAKNWGSYSPDAIQNAISGIDKLMKSKAAVLPQEVVVSRGWGSDGLNYGLPGYNVKDAALGKYNGMQFSDQGFVSTAAGGGGFSGQRSSIELPKGTMGLPVNGHSIYSHEEEYLLARGSTFKVIGWDSKHAVLRLRVVAQEAPGSGPLVGVAQMKKRMQIKKFTGVPSWIMCEM